MSNDKKIQPAWKDAFTKKKPIPKNQESVNVKVSGHILITDDLGEVVLDKTNAVHPQNMSRIICRALSNESNDSVYKIGFGRGGTTIGGSNNVIYKPPFTGTGPTGWNDKLYDQTYYEIVDDSNISFASGPGADPASDPNPLSTDVGVRSAEVGNGPGAYSQTVVKVVLNANEPSGQLVNDLNATNAEGDFVFDEIGLFSGGLPLSATKGYQDVNVGNKTLADDTLLLSSTSYNFKIVVDGGPNTTVTIMTGVGVVYFSNLVSLINNALVGLSLAASVDIQPSTYGFLRFTSNGTPGSTSSIVLSAGTGSDLFAALTGGAILETPVNGENAGVANNSTTPSLEGERLLTHAIFHPILKSANRTWTLIYTLKVSVI